MLVCNSRLLLDCVRSFSEWVFRPYSEYHEMQCKIIHNDTFDCRHKNKKPINKENYKCSERERERERFNCNNLMVYNAVTQWFLKQAKPLVYHKVTIKSYFLDTIWFNFQNWWNYQFHHHLLLHRYRTDLK